MIIRHRATFPQRSIIAAAGLNFGVRDGNQCIPYAKSTGQALLAYRKPEHTGVWNDCGRCIAGPDRRSYRERQMSKMNGYAY